MPRKNIKLFHGKPMLHYAIENARRSGLFDMIVVTTDDDEITEVAYEGGADWVHIRPPCDGTVGTQEVAKLVLEDFDEGEYGLACVLYPCTPLLTWRDIVYSRNLLFTSPTRDYAYTVDQRGNDVGGLYWGWAQAFRERAPLKDNAHQWAVNSIDINTPEDWAQAERMYGERYGN